jgi:hypothetical protein
MEHKRTPGDGRTEHLEGLDRDYILAMSGALPETAVAELPWWAWVLIVAVVVAFVAVLVRFG